MAVRYELNGYPVEDDPAEFSTIVELVNIAYDHDLDTDVWYVTYQYRLA